MVQGLRLHAVNVGGLGSIPGQETRSHMLRLRVLMPRLKILRATTKTRCSQINTYLNIKKNTVSPWKGGMACGCQGCVAE